MFSHDCTVSQDISEVHPSIKGGDIWPKMRSMKQQDGQCGQISLKLRKGSRYVAGIRSIRLSFSIKHQGRVRMNKRL